MTLKFQTFLNNIEINMDNKMKDGFYEYHDVFEVRVGVYLPIEETIF